MAGRVVRSLSGIIGEAERLGHASRNVAKGVRVRNAKRHKARPVIPTKGELARLVKAAEAAKPGDKAMMMILIFAGLLASELRALQWRHEIVIAHVLPPVSNSHLVCLTLFVNNI